VSLKFPVPSASGTPASRHAWQVGDVLDLLAGLVAVGLIVLVDERWSGLPRILLALGFAFFVPGRAIVSNWHRTARWSPTAMSMVLSLAILALLATVTLWAHFWHPLGLFESEAWLSLAALTIGTVRRSRHRPDLDARQANQGTGI
jgi:hypothetical protein